MRPVQTQDLDKAWLMRKECRAKVSAEATPETVHAAFRRLFPMPCRSRYVALCLLPQQPILARLVRCPCCVSPCIHQPISGAKIALASTEKAHVGETPAITDEGRLPLIIPQVSELQASASQRVLPSKDKSAAYWVTTAVIVAGALAGLALLRRR